MTSSEDTAREQLLDEVVACYLKVLDEGQDPDRQEWLARYPDLASGLLDFFRDQDHFFGQSWETAAGARTLEPAPPPRDPFGVGSLIAGRYRVFDVKSGGMGRVYLADDIMPGEGFIFPQVAIKTVPDFSEWADARISRGAPANPALYGSHVARFRREAIEWVRLGVHQNIIWAMFVLDVGAKPYLVMEYADGGDLRDWIGSTFSRPSGSDKGVDGAGDPEYGDVPLAVNFAIQFCEGMQHAVRVSGMVHRDIKPANVLIKDHRVVKIADFGLAKALAAETDNPATSSIPAVGDYTLSALGFGTEAYMAPEQFEDFRHCDTRSDIFSFGAMLHEMLTGHQLFCARSAHAMATARVALPGAHTLNPAIPVSLAEIVTRCLAYEPGKRYRSFAEVGSQLEQVNRTLPGAVQPPLVAVETTGKLTPSLRILSESYSLISLGRHKDAAECARRGIELDPQDFQHWLNRGVATSGLGDLPTALDCLTRAVSLQPTYARAWANLGWVKLQLGDAVGGLAAARQAVRISEDFSEGWMCQGVCQQKLGDLPAALKSLRRALKLAPHDWKIHANLGQCLADMDRPGEALFALKHAVAINPNDASSWVRIGWLYGLAGRWTDARVATDHAVTLNPRDATSWAIRAWVLWATATDMAEAREAEESLGKALQLDPENRQAGTVRDIMAVPNN